MTQRWYSLSSSFFPPFLSIPQPEHASCLATSFLSLLTQVRGCNPWPGNESLSQYVLPLHLINPYLAQALCGCWNKATCRSGHESLVSLGSFAPGKHCMQKFTQVWDRRCSEYRTTWPVISRKHWYEQCNGRLYAFLFTECGDSNDITLIARWFFFISSPLIQQQPVSTEKVLPYFLVLSILFPFLSICPQFVLKFPYCFLPPLTSR